MSLSGSFECVLVGGQSLLIQCANRLLHNGHHVHAIISDETAVHHWAGSHTIPVYAHNKANVQKLTALRYDYLFSIANLKVLPDQLIVNAKKLAINFHDGPLPGYAGLNTPTWAIINRETEHAINWHVMTSEVDKGDILVSRTVPIDAGDTSLSLNTKCFEAGIDAFETLLEQLESNTLSPVKQDLTQHQYFAKCKRPAAVSTINWQQPAEDIDALARALDFGHYWNPIGFCKIYLGNTVAIANGVVNTGTSSSAQPGTLVSIDKGIVVATTTNDIRISGLRSLDGTELAISALLAQSGIKQGQVLPHISADQTNKLSELDRQACQAESLWLKRLSFLEPIELPFTQRSSGQQEAAPAARAALATPAHFVNQTTGSADRLAQALMLYLGKLGQKDNFAIAFNNLVNQDDISTRYFEQKLPFIVTLDYKQSGSGYFQQMNEEFTQHRKMTGYCRELTLREPHLAANWREHSSDCLSISIFRSKSDVQQISQTGDLIVIVPDDGKHSYWYYNDRAISPASIQRMQDQFCVLLDQLITSTDKTLGELTIATQDDLQRIERWNQTDADYDRAVCIHQLFERQVEKTPDAIALSFQGVDLSYAQLNARANQIANLLIAKNVKPDNLVGILIDRSADMIIAMLGTLKAGAAYLPLDPTYPADRISFMIEDGEVSALLTQQKHAQQFSNISNTILVDKDAAEIRNQSEQSPATAVTSRNLAYTIYTSGSTGKPKGVMVEHQNVVNFFVGMDQRIGADQPGVWLAVTSISFDISVLEIFWTLARGFQVVLYSDAQRKSARKSRTRYPDQDMEFSLFYWNVANEDSNEDADKYRLLLESAKFGDQNGFSAVWTPERHFHSFGGLYPNPSVTSAALATITTNIKLRAGSCVVPLHHPIRIAEEWAMVDNFSNGRVGIAMAAGWQPNDFVIMPQNHSEAKKVMFESIELVKKLWRGETIEFPGPTGKPVQVHTLPRPVQKELSVWVTTAGNPETFRQAGEIGAHILTHLLGQSVDDVAKNLQIYRDAYKAAGHAGEGQVTLLLHTLVGNDADQIKALARAPMKNYLKSAMFLVKAAAWHFPTFKEMSEASGQTLDEYFANISEQDLDQLLDFAFERYYSTSGLFGTPESCLAMVDKLKEIGVTEIGCLIDYGLGTDIVLQHLKYLNELRTLGEKQVQAEAETDLEFSIPGLINYYNVTHLQCTPSMADMLASDPESAQSLKSLQYMMVGGEAFPPSLSERLTNLVQGSVINMYGPTETTIWSTTHQVGKTERQIPIGTAIVNTQIYIMDAGMNQTPVGVPGELIIAGDGVVRGYHKRPELTAEKFIPNSVTDAKSERMYRTGDLARYNEQGILEYLGRIDHQVKIRGYRIELGEIEEQIQRFEGIHQAIVLLREDQPGDKRLVAYFVPENKQKIEIQYLRNHLKQHLPEFMVPSAYVVLAEFPLTPNGKINRKALPVPDVERITTVEYVAPSTELESDIAAIWIELLEVEQVGMNDNFFDLGGHSLTAVQVAHKIRQSFNIEFPLQTMFQKPVLSELISTVEHALLEHVDDDELAAMLAELEGMSDEEAASSMRPSKH